VLAYLARRLVLAVITVWAVSALSFVIIKLPPGDFVSTYIAQIQSGGGTVSEQEAITLRQEYGLNDPGYVQYAKWMWRVLNGDFGRSMSEQRPVTDVIGDSLLLTVVISLAAVAVTWLVALPIGSYSAVKQYSIGDYVFTFFGFLGLAIPGFLLALAAMYVGFAYFNVNVGGLFSPSYANAPWSVGKVRDLLLHLPLPALIVGLASTAQLIRIMRANLLDELRKPYVVTARAKGLSESVAILRYPVRVALNPFASTIGYLFPFIVSGGIIVSLVLGLPTLGPILYQALVAQDMFVAGAMILLLGTLTVIGTLISDLLLMWIDPRIRLERRG
jgi:peptide/nickel transport system permease protein